MKCFSLALVGLSFQPYIRGAPCRRSRRMAPRMRSGSGVNLIAIAHSPTISRPVIATTARYRARSRAKLLSKPASIKNLSGCEDDRNDRREQHEAERDDGSRHDGGVSGGELHQHR